jgi:hypothetical protein
MVAMAVGGVRTWCESGPVRSGTVLPKCEI